MRMGARDTAGVSKLSRLRDPNGAGGKEFSVFLAGGGSKEI